MTIRRTPADFLVEEELTGEFAAGISDGGAAYAVYRVTKTSLTTPEAAAMLGKALGVKAGAVEWGGLKDKHAVTVQRMSVRAGERGIGQAADGRGWSASLEGWSPQPMSAASVQGNRFTIVVRDLSRMAAGMMDTRAVTFMPGADRSRVWIVNYFGDQRFGSARHGEGFAAARLIRGDFEGALKLLIATPARKDSGKKREFTRGAAEGWGNWRQLAEQLPRCPERAAVEALATGAQFREAFAALPYQLQNLCVEAYQSHLWNRIARQVVGASRDAWVTGDPFGDMVFPRYTAVADTWRDLDIPLPGEETAPREPWKDAAQAVLAEEGIHSLSELRIPGMRRPRFDEHPRRLFAEAGSFEMTGPEADELSGGRRLKRTVRFALPRGAFATVVLRALGQ